MSSTPTDSQISEKSALLDRYGQKYQREMDVILR